MEKEKFYEILDFAIEKEHEAVEFYLNLQKIVKDTASKAVLHDLEMMERGHVQILQGISPSQVTTFSPEKIANLQISDYMVTNEPNPEMTFQEVLAIAMKREEAAKNLYLALSNDTDDEGMKTLFMKLSTEEAKHKLQLETIYDDIILKEN